MAAFRNPVLGLVLVLAGLRGLPAPVDVLLSTWLDRRGFNPLMQFLPIQSGLEIAAQLLLVGAGIAVVRGRRWAPIALAGYSLVSIASAIPRFAMLEPEVLPLAATAIGALGGPLLVIAIGRGSAARVPADTAAALVANAAMALVTTSIWEVEATAAAGGAELAGHLLAVACFVAVALVALWAARGLLRGGGRRPLAIYAAVAVIWLLALAAVDIASEDRMRTSATIDMACIAGFGIARLVALWLYTPAAPAPADRRAAARAVAWLALWLAPWVLASSVAMFGVRRFGFETRTLVAGLVLAGTLAALLVATAHAVLRERAGAAAMAVATAAVAAVLVVVAVVAYHGRPPLLGTVPSDALGIAAGTAFALVWATLRLERDHGAEAGDQREVARVAE